MAKIASKKAKTRLNFQTRFVPCLQRDLGGRGGSHPRGRRGGDPPGACGLGGSGGEDFGGGVGDGGAKDEEVFKSRTRSAVRFLAVLLLLLLRRTLSRILTPYWVPQLTCFCFGQEVRLDCYKFAGP